MRQRWGAVKPPIGIISNCGVCGGLMFNAQHYMHMNDAYFSPSTIWFSHEMKVFDRILHKLQYLDREHPHHFALDLDQLDRIFEHWFIQSRSYSFLATSVELEYMFNILGFLWLHHRSPPHLLYLLEKLIDGLSDEYETTMFNCYYYSIRSCDWYESIIQYGATNYGRQQAARFSL